MKFMIPHTEEKHSGVSWAFEVGLQILNYKQRNMCSIIRKKNNKKKQTYDWKLIGHISDKFYQRIPF